MKISIYWQIFRRKAFRNVWSSTKHILLSKPLNLIGCHGKQKAKFAKNSENLTLQKLSEG